MIRGSPTLLDFSCGSIPSLLGCSGAFGLEGSRRVNQRFWDWKNAPTASTFPHLFFAKKMHHISMLPPTDHQRQSPFPHLLTSEHYPSGRFGHSIVVARPRLLGAPPNHPVPSLLWQLLAWANGTALWWPDLSANRRAP